MNLVKVKLRLRLNVVESEPKWCVGREAETVSELQVTHVELSEESKRFSVVHPKGVLPDGLE